MNLLQGPGSALKIHISKLVNTMQILLLDGGLGTTLEASPFNVQFTPEKPLWSSHLLIDSPSTLQAAHHAFCDAGADIILTATYQTSTEGFTRTNSSYTARDAAQYMRSAIPLVRSAVSSTADDKKRSVALSLGPYGATMSPVSAEYTGIYPPEMDGENALREWHTQRLKIFTESEDESWDQVDYIAFETLRRADEVCAVRGAVCDVVGRDSTSKKPWWICGVFPGEQVDEEEIRQWVRAAVGNHPGLPRPWGIGLNCTRIDRVEAIVSIMRDEVRRLLDQAQIDEWASSKPWLVLYPDGTKGEKYDPVTKTWVQSVTDTVKRPWDEIFWDIIQHQSKAEWGGIVVGGCCRAGPADIAALRRRIDSDRVD
ncbi:homocysteine S-methyltransferase, putative [Talaromyces stipitatus ATCC 10500]|uniref:Homocysteine S-methyltransferase, putative n=1 Tax=Talaromyces stipitatus (strain ATCC 10500 / CBS 375.48 / QM 6759 / NRRL 1006) TaxID=441959 RepID=B8M2P0_TALSN|nr:homocysteine S-methyltransferase, putative [Talaromyces stipitatus ATCC 10500]EED21951.1 homocysteine S-methyltransferase, putative [Talaromyces stipitatus ATCC 10500]